MGSITLTVPSAGQVIAAGLHATNYAALQTLLNGNLDAANIADGVITQAEMAAGNKVTAGAISAGPPTSPATGDIWIATGVGANGEVWQFRYNGASASAYKWEFIGGPPVAVYGTATNSTSGATAVDVAGISNLTFPRAGDYLINATAIGGTNSATVGLRLYYQLSIAGSAAGATMMSSNKGTSNDASDVHFNIWHRANGVANSALLKTQFYTNDGTYTMYVTPKILSMIPFRIS